MAAVGTEREVKLDVGAGFAIPGLDGVTDGVTAESLAELRMAATYVDTPDLRLMRSGVTLRHRQEREVDGATVSEWTLKLPLPGEGRSVVRRELRWEGDAADLPGEADVLVRPWRRVEALGVVVRLVQVRSRTVLRRGGEVVAEVDDDVVSVMNGSRLEARFRQVEVEVQPSAPAGLLEAVLGRLERAGARAGDDRPKVRRALGGRADGPPDVVVRSVGRRSSAGDLAAAAAANGWVDLAGLQAALLLGDDPDDVTRALVAARQVDAGLRLLAPALDRAWLGRVTTGLAPLVAALAALASADSLRAALGRACSHLGAPDAAVGEALVAGRTRPDRTGLAAVLGSDGYAEVLELLAAGPVPAGSAGPPGPASPGTGPGEPGSSLSVPAGPARPGAGAAGVPARSVVASRVAPVHRRLFDARACLDGAVGGSARVRLAALAALAGAAEDLGYACAVASTVLGEAPAALGAAAADLAAAANRALADAEAAEWLWQVGSGRAPDTAFVAGLLASAARREAAGSAGALPQAADRVGRKAATGWLLR